MFSVPVAVTVSALAILKTTPVPRVSVWVAGTLKLAPATKAAPGMLAVVIVIRLDTVPTSIRM